MVDATALFDGAARQTAHPEAAAWIDAPLVVNVSSDGADYTSFCAGAVFAPPQSPAWVDAWKREVRPDDVYVSLQRDGTPVLMLALEIVSWRGCRIARFMGGRHANGNFPACTNPVQFDAEAFDRIAQAVRAERKDIDLIALERLAPACEGSSNPLWHLRGFASPNPALAVDLDGGFDALLARTSGKRKRKKYRSQLRKFEAAGGVRRIEAATRHETDRLLDAFFAMKTFRFQKAGIRNVFGDSEIQAFFRRLFAEALGSPRPAFVLHGLEVAGKLRAITGSSRSGGRMTCEFGAIAEDEVSQTSPGDFLFFENIKEACDRGLAVYDFGVGDEPYKRLWCDIETEHRDVLLPLTLTGRVAAQAMRSFAVIKARIKNSPTVWRLAKRLRRGAIGAHPVAEDRGED